jgi:hypothetical protein
MLLASRRRVTFLAFGAGALVAASACGSTDAGAGADGGGGAAGGAGSCVDTGERPGPRAESFGAFDEMRDRLVFFGGDSGMPKQCMPSPHPIGETWIYDPTCRSFTEAMTTSDPGARARGAAVYDASDDRLVLFGGRYRQAASGPYTVYGDVWSLDLAAMQWTELDGGTGPAGRSSTAAAFDTTKGEMIVYGGNSSTSGLTFTPLGDTWAFDVKAGAWRQIATSGDPAKRLFHAAAIDPEGRRFFVYGGGGADAFTGPFYADLWSLDLESGAWTELSDGAGGPRGRIQASLAYDAAKGRLLVFGGHDDGTIGNSNDTWAFDLASNAWVNITPAEAITDPPTGFCDFPADFTAPNLDAPDRRSSQVSGFDATRGALYVFGGATDCGLIDDVWRFDAAADVWANQVPATIGEACTRGSDPSSCQSLCQ